MTKSLTTAFLFTIATLASPAIAQAGDKPVFKSALEYSQSAPIEETYQSFKSQSRQACVKQIRSVRSLYVRHQFLSQCSAELLDNAIAELSDPALTQYHAMQQGDVQTRRFAQTTR